MSKASLETEIRNKFLSEIVSMVSEKFDTDALPVSASELAIPCLDSEGNETFALIKVSIPRGTRNGNGGYDPYDGYYLAELYAEDVKNRAVRKAESEALKQAKIAQDEARRAEKKALAEANKGLKELKNIKVTPEE